MSQTVVCLAAMPAEAAPEFFRKAAGAAARAAAAHRPAALDPGRRGPRPDGGERTRRGLAERGRREHDLSWVQDAAALAPSVLAAVHGIVTCGHGAGAMIDAFASAVSSGKPRLDRPPHEHQALVGFVARNVRSPCSTSPASRPIRPRRPVRSPVKKSPESRTGPTARLKRRAHHGQPVSARRQLLKSFRFRRVRIQQDPERFPMGGPISALQGLLPSRQGAARLLPDSSTMPQLARSTLAMVLAGGRGTRLGQLTDWRAKPAVPFGGKFRIIDFALSNCVNSGIRRIGVCTQYKSHEPDPPRAARLELPRRALRRVHRAAAGAAARRTPTGTRAPPTPSTRTSTSCAATDPKLRAGAGRRPHLQDGLRAACSPSTSSAAPT